MSNNDVAEAKEEVVEQPEEETPAPGSEGENESSDEQVTLTKKELETLQNKARDFDGMLQKQRLAKLHKKEEPDVVESKDSGSIDQKELIRVAEEAAERKAVELDRQRNQQLYESNLGNAFAKLSENYKFVNDDEAMSKLSEVYDPKNALTQEQIYTRLERALEDAFPTQYSESKESVIRKKVMADLNKKSAGDIGGSGFRNEEVKTDMKLSPQEQAILDRRGLKPGDVQENMARN